MDENIKTGEEITNALQKEVLSLVQWASNLADSDFFKSTNKKWSTGEQLEHLRKSSSPIALALRLPKFVLRIVVGKPNRPSRTFDEVKAKYQLKLEIQGVPTTRYYPNLDLKISKRKILDDYLSTSEKLIRIISKWQDRDLDKYILPHPLLGKVTVREMLFFTIYHTRHHAAAMHEYYS